MSEWIKCSDVEPHYGAMLVSDGKQMHVAIWDDDSECYITGSGERCNYCGGLGRCHFQQTKNIKYNWIFTHWAELPQPPVESSYDPNHCKYSKEKGVIIHGIIAKPPLYDNSTYDPISKVEITQGGWTIIHDLVVDSPSLPAEPASLEVQVHDVLDPHRHDPSHAGDDPARYREDL